MPHAGYVFSQSVPHGSEVVERIRDGRRSLFDVESDPGSQFDQPSVLARATGASHHKLTIRLWLHHASASCVFRLDPDRDGDRGHWGSLSLGLGEICHQAGVGNHQLLRLSDELFEPLLLAGRDGASGVLIQQFIETSLLRSGKLLQLRRQGFFHRFDSRGSVDGCLGSHTTHSDYSTVQLNVTTQQRTRLKEIRQMLGADDPEETSEEANELHGDSDLAQGDDLGPGYACPVCKQGRMIRGPELPRPTVPQIMTMPFPGEAYVEKQRKRLKAMGRRRRKTETYWPAVAPSGELEQRLLPFGFT